jgi:surface antigen
MRKTVLSVGLLVSAIFLVTTKGVAAAPTQPFAMTDNLLVPFVWQKSSFAEQKDTTNSNHADELVQKKKDEAKAKVDKKAAAAKLAKERKIHKVATGESLTKVADIYNTTWQRLYAKNTKITNPDILNTGDSITIPLPKEKLKDRATPVQAPTATTAATSGYTAPASSAPAASPVNYTVASSAGNTYAPGYCTWYAKSRRPDLPNRLGNASSWVGSAAAQGFATGSTPRAGAIGQQGNHVVYVESVQGNTVTVSEMNYVGLYVTSSRTVAASNFTYIY